MKAGTLIDYTVRVLGCRARWTTLITVLRLIPNSREMDSIDLFSE
jgi:hypothetical protein